MKKYLLTFALFSLFFTACKDDIQIDKLQVISKLSFKLPQAEFEKFNLNQEKLQKYGWNYKNGYATLTIKFPLHSVILKNGDTVQLDKNSMVNVYNNTDFDPVKIILDKYTMDLKLNSNMLILDAASYMLKMDGCCDGGNNLKKLSVIKGATNVMAIPRCVDFNGPLGNGQNDAGGFQEGINFIGSTCNLALLQGNCVGEHMNGAGGCYNTHGGKLCGELVDKFDPGRNGGLSITNKNKYE